MPGQHKKRREYGFDYAPLFARIQENFTPSEMTAEAIKEYINAKTSGMDGLAEQLSQVSIIAQQIESLTSIEELRNLRDDVSKLNVHSGTLDIRINEREIALSISKTDEFAQSRGINLGNKIKGNVETWKDGKTRIVIRKKGTLRAWRLV